MSQSAKHQGPVVDHESEAAARLATMLVNAAHELQDAATEFTQVQMWETARSTIGWLHAGLTATRQE